MSTIVLSLFTRAHGSHKVNSCSNTRVVVVVVVGRGSVGDYPAVGFPTVTLKKK